MVHNFFARKNSLWSNAATFYPALVPPRPSHRRSSVAPTRRVLFLLVAYLRSYIFAAQFLFDFRNLEKKFGAYSFHFPGHALHEKGLQRQIRRRSTVRQPGTKRASRPADKPLINRWSTADFVPPSVYTGFRLFVLLGRR